MGIAEEKRLWASIMDRIDFPQACLDEECPYLLTVPDMYDTGDSPTGFECQCRKAKGCPFFED